MLYVKREDKVSSFSLFSPKAILDRKKKKQQQHKKREGLSCDESELQSVIKSNSAYLFVKCWVLEYYICLIKNSSASKNKVDF